METIHIVIAVLSVLGSFFLYHQKLREEIINQRIDMMEKFNKKQAEDCLTGIKDIKEALKDIQQKLTEHTKVNGALQIEVERIKSDFENIKNKIDHLERLFDAFAIKRETSNK